MSSAYELHSRAWASACDEASEHAQLVFECCALSARNDTDAYRAFERHLLDDLRPRALAIADRREAAYRAMRATEPSNRAIPVGPDDIFPF
jgi:hypothetical protein